MGQLALPNAAIVSNAEELWEVEGSYSLPGLTEVDKEWLIGVPHVITKVTFWVPKKGIGHCSVEATIAPEHALSAQLKREKIEALDPSGAPMVEPGEQVVYSDGSTGIRRTLVAMLQAADVIDVGHADLAETGKLGECRYDAPWTDWDRIDSTTMQGAVEVPSFEKNHVGGQLKIRVTRGLQKSDYNDGESTTYYLAG